MSFRISFVVPDEEEAKVFVGDANHDGPSAPVICWIDVEGEEHEWRVTDVKYEAVHG